ncbi:radical SAM protein [Actinoplanes derwentensis]|nr:radical SAM protein [Actinoplanes derwentensis]
MVIEEQLCQMRCSYCLTEEYNLLMNVPDAKLRLTTDRREDWKAILDLYHENVDAPIMRLSGGEFFWLKGSTEFVAEACQRYETVQVITNGVFLTEHRLQALSALGNCTLSISLDGHTLELNGHRLPAKQARLHDTIMRHLDNAVNAGLRLEIQSVLTDVNVHGQVAFAEFLRDRYDGKVTLYFFPVRGEIIKQMGPPPGEHLAPLVEHYDEFAGVLPPKAFVEHIHEKVRGGKRTLPCYITSMMVQLFGQGDVSACPHAWIKPMGNLNSEPLLVIEKYGNHQHYDFFMQDRPRFPFCQTCVTPSDVLNLYLLDRVSDEEISRSAIYGGPRSMQRLKEIKTAFAPVLKQSAEPGE